MEEADIVVDAYVRGVRMPVLRSRDTMTEGSSVLGMRIPNPVMMVRSATTTACTDATLCEKPAGGNMGVVIGCSVAIPIVIAFGVLIYLHRRAVRRQRIEDAKDPHRSLDFGLGDNPGKGKRNGEKNPGGRYNRQMSMDLNMSSPYLLPPEMQGSRESMNSLARTLHQNEDPYRHIGHYANSDVGSMRSLEKGRSSLVYGSGPGRISRSTTLDTGSSGPSRQNSLPPKSPLSSPVDPFSTKAPSEFPQDFSPNSPTPPPPAYKETLTAPPEPIVPEIVTPSMDDFQMPAVPVIQEPTPVAQINRKPPPISKMQGPSDSADDIAANEAAWDKNNQAETPFNPALSHHSPPMSPPPTNALPATPQPVRKEVPQPTIPIVEEPQQAYSDYVEMPPSPKEQQSSRRQQEEEEEEPRGRNMARMSHMYGQDGQQGGNGGGLGVPQQANKRLSVGFRPLPPDEITDSEDPEYRANRIRSFYKEYFEDKGPTEPVPPLPQQHQARNQQQQQQQQQYAQQQNYAPNYYEDYDAGYLGDATYFDPDSNAFVMPYAQPVARRAMTPPPLGQRFPGPRGPGGPRPPYARSGSMGGPHGMPSPRPGSSASARMMGRPRAGSTMSAGPGRFGPPAPKKRMPPPAALSTLPTPSQLKDDSFALMGAIDFAPPPTFADQVRGRSQSPMGERRPYQLNVPVSSPLVTSFDELAALPSPHLLRKSGTFTALDFAPPRKFADSDTRSETGSIRSNRSGISAVQLGAIRNGAGRVSRLPGDTIFTQAATQEALKPQWGMRP